LRLLGRAGLEFDLHVWLDNFLNKFQVQSELAIAIDQQFQENKIVMSFQGVKVKYKPKGTEEMQLETSREALRQKRGDILGKVRRLRRVHPTSMAGAMSDAGIDGGIMGNRLWGVLWTILIVVGSTAFPAGAQEGQLPMDTALVGRELKIGVVVAPPFLEKDAAGHLSGIALDLWRDVARDMGVRWKVVEYELEPLLDAVRDGAVDVGVSALSITPERENLMDFSQPFYYSGLGIAVPAKEPGGIVSRIFDAIFSKRVLLYIGSLLGLLLLVGTVVWFMERRRNPRNFRPGARGIGDGLWWSAVTMTSVGYGDTTPKTLAGRAVALVWMFASVALLASFTAGITSSLTLESMGGAAIEPEDLNKVRTGVVRGTSAEEELVASHTGIYRYDTVENGLQALLKGDLDAFVHDQPILQYYQHQEYTGRLRVLPVFFDPQLYGFAFPRGSALRKIVNVAMLRRLEDSQYRDRLFGPYLGKAAGR